MRKVLLSLLVLIPILVSAQGDGEPIGIGHWRDHFSYFQVHCVALAHHQVYAAANQGLICYDEDDLSIERINKTNRLNDVGIATIAYSDALHMLVVAYNNANVDLLTDTKTYNISGIMRSNTGGSKRINAITIHGHRAYLACGFGIVVVDLNRHEIEDTYYLGHEGGYLAVNDIVFSDHLIIAATDQGLRYAPQSQQFLNISSNWTEDTTTPLSDLEVKKLTVIGHQLLATTPSAEGGSDLFRLTLQADNITSPSLLPWLSGDIRSIHSDNSKLAISQYTHVDIYDSTLQQIERISDVGWMTMAATDARIDAQGNLWLATQWYGLASVEAQTHKLSTFYRTGPSSDKSYKLVPFKEKMILCPGGKSTTFASAYIPATVSTFAQNYWKSLPAHTLLDSLYDIVDVAVNPRDTSYMLAASWGGGILEIVKNTPTKLYTEANTDGAIAPYSQGGYSSLRTGSVCFDKKGNAWMTNSLQDRGLVVRHNDGKWESFYTRNMTLDDEIDHILWDSVRNYVWFYGRANKLFVSDGQGRMAYVDPNNGSKMQTSSVTTLIQDHNGDLWIGTNKGIKLLSNLYKAFDGGGNGEKSPITSLNIIISSGDIAEYLMAYESITTMAVDGANRKWVGTANGGLYLLSANGLDEIQHFTASNSPLLSNKIISVAVQPQTGEVFIATDQGLQSYRSTATYATSQPLDNIHAFPNPVKPDYNGPIAIKGFTRNAIVHITDVAGHVVCATQAFGGQAVWNGLTPSGEPAPSGTYFVFASNESGQMKSVTKLLIIR